MRCEYTFRLLSKSGNAERGRCELGVEVAVFLGATLGDTRILCRGSTTIQFIYNTVSVGFLCQTKELVQISKN
jgi:hypothetical protein